ncbi:MAG TPA: S8 family serine peptidase [Thermoanaerobaculia bacterium]|nr:S8 family serine peptidase [Thermoanaerobaculia bacterium]
MTLRRLSFPLAVSLWCLSGAAAQTSARLDPLLDLLLRNEAKEQSGGSPGGPAGVVASFEGGSGDASGSGRRLQLLLDFQGDEKDLAAAGFKVRSRIGSIFTGLLEPARLKDLARLQGLKFVQLSQRMHTLQESEGASPAPPWGQGPAEWAPQSAGTPRGGAGVVVGIVDTGVDIFHEDFRRADGRTRIQYLLDLSVPGDIDGDGELDGPDELGGTLYTAVEIDRALKSGSPAFPSKDTTGHGTHVLSVAAGDDPRWPGLAPEADLIVVKGTREDGTLDFQSADVIGALAFIDRKAEELRKPYIANLSLGTIFGSHDGRSLEELAIDALVGPGVPGKAVVLAAGNAGGGRGGLFRHFSGRAFVGTGSSHTLSIPSYTAARPGPGNDQVLVDLWYEGGDRITITVTPPGSGAGVGAEYGQLVEKATPAGRILIANLGGANPLNGDTEALILIDDTAGTAPRAGNWTITLTGTEIMESGLYHGWVLDNSSVGEKEPGITQGGDDRYLVGKPGTARNGITVGSFARHAAGTRFQTSWTDVHGVRRVDTSARPEAISGFSSPGRTRDERLKPELTAPGEQVIGAVSRDAYPGRGPHSIFLEHPFSSSDALIVSAAPNRAFGALQGTSFAAPVVTGLAARILATAPGLDADEVRNVLLHTAAGDRSTGILPNETWGYGKVDTMLAQRLGAPLPPPLRIDTDPLPQGIVQREYAQPVPVSGGAPPYTWRLVQGTLPPGLALTRDGLIHGIPVAAGTAVFQVEVQDSTRVPWRVAETLRLIIGSQVPLEIASCQSLTGKVGEAVGAALDAMGGVPPLRWSLAGGSLPRSVSLREDGALEGTPQSGGVFWFTAAVEDARGDRNRRSCRLRVAEELAESWRELGVSQYAVQAIAVDPSDSAHLAVLLSDYTAEWIKETFDGGDSWNALGPSNVFQSIRLVFDPVSSDAWRIGFTWSELLRYDPSIHDWSGWTYCPGGRNDLSHLNDLGFDDQGRMLVLHQGVRCFQNPQYDLPPGLLMSHDRGRSWQVLGPLPTSPLGDAQKGFIAVSKGDPRFQYAAVGGACTTQGCSPSNWLEKLYRSGSGGRAWEEIPTSLGYLFGPAVSRTDSLDVILYPAAYDHAASVMRTVDGGKSWSTYPVTGARNVCSMVRSPSVPSVLYAMATEGLFKSVDTGQTWSRTALQDVGDLCLSTSLAVDPADSDKVYVGTGRQGLVASQDGGASWSWKNRKLASRKLNGIAVSATSPDDILVTAVNEGPQVSRHGGSRWIASSAGFSGFDHYELSSQPAISAADSSLYFFVSKAGLWRSDNKGVTWFRPNPEIGNQATGTSVFGERGTEIAELALDPLDADVLVVRLVMLTEDHPLERVPRGLWRSRDRGRTWQQISEVGAAPTAGYDAGTEPNLFFSRYTPGRLFSDGKDGLYRSDDKGDTWMLLGTFPWFPEGAAYTFVQMVEPAGRRDELIYVGTDRGMYVFNTVEKTWTPAFSGIYSAVAVDIEDPKVAYVAGSRDGEDGLFRTANAGASWTRLESFPKELGVGGLASHPSSPGVVFAATYLDGVYQSEDRGESWTPLAEYRSVADTVNVAVQAPGSPKTLYVATEGFGVQVSTDAGQTFVPRVDGLGNLNVLSLAFDPEVPGTAYAGTEKGLFKTVDGAATWQATGLVDGIVTDVSIEHGTKPRRVTITTFNLGVGVSLDEGQTFHFSQSGLSSLALTSVETEARGASSRLWVTMRGGDGVANSDDGGTSWHSAAGSGLTDRDVNDLVVEPAPSKRIWIATGSGIFYTDDAGTTWQAFSSGLPPGMAVKSISIDPRTGELWASTESAGVYRNGNRSSTWVSFNRGLTELRARKLSHGDVQAAAAPQTVTFYVATDGDGVYGVGIGAPP